MPSPETAGSLQDTAIESLRNDPRIIVVGGREKITLETHPRNGPHRRTEAFDKLDRELDIYVHPKRPIAPRKTYRLDNLLDSLIPEIPVNYFTTDRNPYVRRNEQGSELFRNTLQIGYLSITEQLSGDEGDRPIKLSTEFMVASNKDTFFRSSFAEEWQSERETCIDQTTRVRLFPTKSLLAYAALGGDPGNASRIYMENEKDLHNFRMLGGAALEQALDAPALKG